MEKVELARVLAAQGPNFLKLAVEEMIARYPEIWKSVYPRVYEEPSTIGSYYSPRTPAIQLLTIALKYIEGHIGKAEQYEFHFASHAVKYGVPIFWVGKDMAEAIKETAPPGEIPWYTLPLPYPACIFMLPKGSLRHPQEGDITHIGFCRMRAGEISESKLIKRHPYGSINGGMIFIAHTAIGQHFYHWNLPLDHFGESITIPDINSTNYTDSNWEHPSGHPLAAASMTPQDNLMMTVVVHYCLGLMMLMQARPDLVTQSKRLRTVSKKGKGAKEFWSPNIIGLNYRIKREHTGGEHNSPRWHWVRGFWREQPYGTRADNLRKRIWIEPFTRGGLQVQ